MAGDDAFISYSHAADARLAEALERGLERLAKPWHRLRAISVFRDQTDLSLNPDLWATISARLDAARHLVLLLCPESAASRWVNQEVAHWCDAKGPDGVLLVWTGGALAWDQDGGDFDAASTAVPAALRGRFAAEPLFLDLRWTRDEAELSLARDRFRTAVAAVAAPIHGVPPDELEGEDLRQHRRARRLARAAVAVVSTLAVVAAVAAVLAVRNADRADRRAREAVARQVGLAALDLPGSELDGALLVALAAGDLADDGDVARYQAAQTLIGRYSRLRAVLHPPTTDPFVSVRDVAVSADGATVAIGTRADGSTALVRWADGDDPGLVELAPGAGATVDAIGLAGDVLVHGGTGPAVVVTPDLGTSTLSGPVLAIDVARSRAWVDDTDPVLVALETGAELARAPTGALLGVGGGMAASLVGGELSIRSDDGVEIGTLTGLPDASRLAIGSDGTVVVATSDRTLIALTAAAGSVTAGPPVALPAAIGEPAWLAVAPTAGTRAVVVGTSGSALVDLAGGGTDVVAGGGAAAAATDPTGRFAAVGGSRLSVWDLTTGRRVVAVPQPAMTLAWSGGCDGDGVCALVAAGVAVDVFDPITATQVRLVDDLGAQSVAISADGVTVATGGWGRSVAVWATRPVSDDTNREPLTAAQLAEWTPDVDGEALDPSCRATLTAVSAAGEYVVAVDPVSAVTAVCRGGDGTRIAFAQLNPAAGEVTAAAVDDRGRVALGRESGFVELYAPVDGTFRRGRAVDVRSGGEEVDVRALAARGGVVVAGLRDRDAAAPARVLIWRIDPQQPTTFATDAVDIAAVAVLDDEASAIVVAGSDDDGGPVTIQLWTTATRRRVGRGLSGLTGEVETLVGAGDRVVAADAAGHAYQWTLDADPEREICEIVGRPLTREEWDEIAGGALQPYGFDPPCAP